MCDSELDLSLLGLWGQEPTCHDMGSQEQETEANLQGPSRLCDVRGVQLERLILGFWVSEW